MRLLQVWQQMIEGQANMPPAKAQAFWAEYYTAEKGIYARLLEDKQFSINGKVGELAASFELEPVIFTGFLDGINESIQPALALDTLEEDTEIAFEILPEKLFYNMLSAKADWLYELPQWEDNLTAGERDAIRRRWREDRIVRVEATPGRNEPCSCGSGKKYKKCCGAGA